MDVDDVHFWPQLLPILNSISKAAFVSIDLEMSGIAMKGSRSKDRAGGTGKPTLQQFYEEVKQAAEKYSVLQFGITCIEEDRERGIYVARPYNFNVTPLFIHDDKLGVKRDITFSSSAMAFLTKNAFDIGAVFTKGVPYLSREEEAFAHLHYVQKQERFAATPDILLSELSSENRVFYEKARKEILSLVNQEKQEMDYVNVGTPGGLSGFQRLLVHYIVRSEFPDYITFARNNGTFMQIEKIDTVKEAKIAKSKLQSFESSVAKQIGLRFIFEALAGAELIGLNPSWFCTNENGEPVLTDLQAVKKNIHEVKEILETEPRVLVGHNLFNDLIFLYRTFVGMLPDEVSDFSRRIHELFPLVFDTKFMVTQEGSSNQSTSGLRDTCDNLRMQQKPSIALAEGHVSYGAIGARAQDHEAGYDSWMTAQVFLRLSAKLAAEQGGIYSSDDGLETQNSTLNYPRGTRGGSRKSRAGKRARDALRMAMNQNSENHTSSTREQKLKQKTDSLFSDENMFSNLKFEAGDVSDSSSSSSPDSDDGGVFLDGSGPVRQASSLMDSDIDDGWRVVSPKQPILRPQSANPVSEMNKNGPNGPEIISPELSRYWAAAQLNKRSLSNNASSETEESREKQWVPASKSPFWKTYANKLRVYATETEVCNLIAEDFDGKILTDFSSVVSHEL